MDVLQVSKLYADRMNSLTHWGKYPSWGPTTVTNPYSSGLMYSKVGHKSHDPCFHEFLMEARDFCGPLYGYTTFRVYITIERAFKDPFVDSFCKAEFQNKKIVFFYILNVLQKNEYLGNISALSKQRQDLEMLTYPAHIFRT